jgi:hypothetical protein
MILEIDECTRKLTDFRGNSKAHRQPLGDALLERTPTKGFACFLHHSVRERSSQYMTERCLAVLSSNLGAASFVDHEVKDRIISGRNCPAEICLLRFLDIHFREADSLGQQVCVLAHSSSSSSPSSSSLCLANRM